MIEKEKSLRDQEIKVCIDLLKEAGASVYEANVEYWVDLREPGIADIVGLVVNGKDLKYEFRRGDKIVIIKVEENG